MKRSPLKKRKAPLKRTAELARQEMRRLSRHAPPPPGPGDPPARDRAAPPSRAAERRAAPDPVLSQRAREREAVKRRAREALGPAIPQRSTKCKRPGCQNPLTGQASIYCSPRCDYDDRGRRGVRQTQAYHRCRGCGGVFAWNGRGKGAYCSSDCKRGDGRKTAEPDVVEVVTLRGHQRQEFVDDHPRCRVCGSRDRLQTHHVIYRQHVERLDGDRWDPDDALRVCSPCHAAQHSRSRLIPRSVLRPANVRFAFALMGDAAEEYLAGRYA